MVNFAIKQRMAAYWLSESSWLEMAAEGANNGHKQHTVDVDIKGKPPHCSQGGRG